MTTESAYFHIPFCRHRCGYCNFSVVAGRDHLIDNFLQAIETELQSVSDRPILQTIYLGGGTPSRLPASALSRLLELIERHFEFARGGEFTMEVNPEDLPGEIAKVIAASQINRISMGIQSFDESKLRSLDRDHSAAQIDLAIECLPSIVDRFSVDLIFAAPHDSETIWAQDLQKAIDSQAGHVSTYELTYEKGTSFWNRLQAGELCEAEQERTASYYEATIETLSKSGFQHYEISSFAKPGQRSRHNQIYWSGKNYFAFGPGAAGLIDGQRFTNHRSVSTYLDRVLKGESPVQESEQMSPRDLAVEQLVFGLRMIEGLEPELFLTRSGFSIAELVPQKTLQSLQEHGLLVSDEKQFRLSEKGRLMGDWVCSKLLDETNIA